MSMGRPKKLHTLVAETVSVTVTRQVVADATLEKLAEQGVPVDGFPIEEFLDRIESGRNMDEFKWPKGTPDRLSLAFSADDKTVMREQVGELVATLTNGELLAVPANVLLEEMIKLLEEIKAFEDTELYGFRRRLRLRWGRTLDLYHLMLRMSHELFSDIDAALRKSRAKRGLPLREALRGIHARALRTGRAVLVLLEHGMADEAYARWRTLYELSVMAAFISRNGDAAASMYMEHEIVSNKKRIDNSIDWDVPLGTKQQREEIDGEYRYLLQKYGESFHKPYGWAAPFLEGTRDPQFADLELATKGRRTVPPYKESSFQVHAGRVGLLGLGSLDGSTITMGHSNAGLDIPLMHSSLAVMQITTLATLHNPVRDLVVVKTLMLLNEKTRVEAEKAARQLDENEEKQSDSVAPALLPSDGGRESPITSQQIEDAGC